MSRNDSSSRYARVQQLLPLPVTSRRSVTVIGLGSMGNPVAIQLARHGVGTQPPGQIRLIDGDEVEKRNMIGTHYRTRHAGLPKAQATAAMIHEINSEVNVSSWNHKLRADDVEKMVEVGRQSDLLCHFADSFDVMFDTADACHDTCAQVMALFGERCDYAEVAFSVPGQTAPLSSTLGRRKRRAIRKPEALGCDTGFVAEFVAAVCLRLLAGDGQGNELLACYADAPLFIIGLRRSWVFANQQPDLVRCVYCVRSPESEGISRNRERR